MSVPSAEEQIKFLAEIQQILDEGDVVATYKYALLLALTEIAVECGDDSGESMTVSTALVAEKFVQYYWRQAVPFVPRSSAAGASSGVVLRQNTKGQALVVRLLYEARGRYDGKLQRFMGDQRRWKSVVAKVRAKIEEDPLRRLQRVGEGVHEFLYVRIEGERAVQLKAGVVYCLRKFHGFIGDLVRGAWLRYIRRFNAADLGSTIDLEEFLFGTEREDLTVIRPILRELQSGKCFYCPKQIDAKAAVDHFVPWSQFPLNLGHNLVLAHHACNSAKSDRLACQHHLDAWIERNHGQGMFLADECNRVGLLNDLPATIRITQWAYRRACENQRLTWHHGKTLEPLSADCSVLIGSILLGLSTAGELTSRDTG
jgi:5-methylcytosine-specific restriction endonuclease McrA